MCERSCRYSFLAAECSYQPELGQPTCGAFSTNYALSNQSSNIMAMCLHLTGNFLLVVLGPHFIMQPYMHSTKRLFFNIVITGQTYPQFDHTSMQYLLSGCRLWPVISMLGCTQISSVISVHIKGNLNLLAHPHKSLGHATYQAAISGAKMHVLQLQLNSGEITHYILQAGKQAAIGIAVVVSCSSARN